MNWQDHVRAELEKMIESGNLPPMIGGGRRTILIPEPRPEDERPRYKTEGEVPDGYMRGEVSKPANAEGRLGGFWAHVKHQDVANPILERVFTGDVIDIPENEYEIVYKKNWIKTPWKKTEPKLPEKTKQAAA